MQINNRFILAALVSISLLASCSKTNKQGRFVPKDAAIVVHVDGASLSAKLPWDEIKQNVLFQELYADSSIPAFIKQALQNPDNSGIDSKKDLIFFAKKDSVGGIIAFTGTIKDAEKFKLFSLDIAKGGIESEKDGVSFISKSPICVGWNKEKFLYLVNAPQLNQKNYNGKNADYLPKPIDLSVTCKNIFDLKESNSLGENEKFTALVKKAGDIHFWMNAEELNKGGMANAAFSMININKLYEGSITTATVNFENGKILIDAKSYANKEMTALWKKFGGKNIDEDMIKRLPSKDVAAVFALSFNPGGIKELLKMMGVEGYANMGLAFAGFSLDDFIKANKGDVLLALTDFKKTMNFSDTINKNGAATMRQEVFKMMPDILFATSIGDKEAFNLLIKAGERLGKGKVDDLSVTYKSDGKHFVMSNSKENTEKFFSTSSGNNVDFLSKISGNPFGVFLNLQYIMKTFENEATKDSSAKVVYDASLKMWDNVYIKGGKIQDGGMTQSVEINLLDKTSNSLKQLNQYLGKIGKLMNEIKKSEETSTKFKQEDIVYPPLSALGDSTKSKK